MNSTYNSSIRLPIWVPNNWVGKYMKIPLIYNNIRGIEEWAKSHLSMQL